MNVETVELYEIEEISEVGYGTRVCIDFIDLLEPDEGLLIGSTGHGFIKVMAETRESDEYPPRAFRVNSGAIHQYTILDEDKTCYLSELRPGMRLSVFGNDRQRSVCIGRVKLEKREIIRIVCTSINKQLSVYLQNSESVFLQSEKDQFISAKELAVGTKIMGVRSEPGRHLGIKIEEDIVEL